MQAELRRQGQTLIVIDCYRPKRAVADMVDWTTQGEETNARWYPDVPRNRLVSDGYLARRSGHSRGSTVDLAIGPIDANGAAPDPSCGVQGARTLEFGTGVDCLDPKSTTASDKVSAQASRNRKRLLTLMRRAGFKNYAREWWHFTLVNEPFKELFDFEVTGK